MRSLLNRRLWQTWMGAAVCGACAPGGHGADGDDVTGGARDASADTVREVGTHREAGVEVTADPGARWFREPMPWARPIEGEAVSTESQAIIADLADAGGWGNGNFFQIDFSITVLEADDTTPRRAFEPTEDWYEGDCDLAAIPLPAGGALEGEDAYACEGDGDCHLIVRDGSSRELFEMWRANVTANGFFGGCLAVWDLDRAYGETLRGAGCTSADAAGLPIAPLLFTADEVASGEIAHAIRFILPNDRIRHRAYVAPATHSTGATGGGANAPPYGVRLRLRADYPLASLPSEGARVVARALQRYGMFLADAGQIALTAQDDRYGGEVRWDGLLSPHDLGALEVGDFEVIEMTRAIAWDGDCLRD